MSWLFLFGLRLLRVHLIALVSVALFLVCIAIALLAQWTPLVSVGFIFGLIGACKAVIWRA